MDKQTEYIEKLSARIVEWDTQIDQLKDKAESVIFEAKVDYSDAIAALQLQRDEAALKLQWISTTSNNEWDNLKTGSAHIWGEVSTSLRDAIIKIK